ncbi:MAG: hypothetical protein JST65_23715 [Acidobacteria bacterium]|nr:hypothetical protein [Acidobacteriota bacterium]
MEPNPSAPAPVTPDPPRGMFAVKVDGKGRLKLPAVFQEYFKGIGCEKFFVTTVDATLLYVYPTAVWRVNEERLDNATATEADLEAAESVRFLANHFGQDVAPDSEWRISIHQELRNTLDLSEKQVHLTYENGYVKGYSEVEFAKRLEAAKGDLGGKLKLLKTKGFK